MNEKEKVLRQISNALVEKVELFSQQDDLFSLYPPLKDDALVVFAQNVSSLGAKFIYCQDEKEMIEKLYSLIEYRQWQNDIYAFGEKLTNFLTPYSIPLNKEDENIEKNLVGISLCQGITTEGIVVLALNEEKNKEEVSFLPQIFIIIVFSSQITQDISSILEQFSSNMPKYINTIDVQKILNGEIKEMYFFAIEDKM
jgi:L-lactate dehydrogenase complex protein LldG